MPNPIACMWCHTVTMLTPCGLLWLCMRCIPTTAPPTCKIHDWRGHNHDGKDCWLCFVCGAALVHQDGRSALEPIPVYDSSSC